MNNKGFAITGLLYTIMLVFLAFTMMILFDLQNKKTILDELKIDTVYAIDSEDNLEGLIARVELLEESNKQLNNKVKTLESNNTNLNNKVQNLETDNKKLNTNYNTIINTWLDKTYPVGSIYVSISATNPKSTLGGTWVIWGRGRVVVGVDTSTEFNTVEKTGGTKTHKLTVNEMPSHKHNMTYSIDGGATWANLQMGTDGVHNKQYYGGFSTTVSSFTDYRVQIGETGGSGAHNNLQPYITAYMWKRTA